MSEALIVGGGLAGGAAAVLLARAGRAVRLFEREAEPADKVCGEFLSVEAQRALARVGIDVDRLGAAPIATLRLAMGARTIEVALPFVARGLTRRRLDAALLDAATAAGARIERGVAVRSLAGDTVETGLGALTAKTILLATGKHDLRGAARDVAGCDTDYVGFKSHWRLPPGARADLAGKVDVTLFEGGYAGLQRVEGDLANLCLLVTKRRLAAAGGNWPALWRSLLLEPHLARMLGDAELLTVRPIAIAGVPYGYVTAERPASGAFRLGDQAAVIPSFCGEGMAIALHSAFAAAEAIAAGATAADHAAKLRRDVGRRVRIAMALQRGGQSAWSRRLLWAVLHAQPRLVTPLVRLTRIPSWPADGAPPHQRTDFWPRVA